MTRLLGLLVLALTGCAIQPHGRTPADPTGPPVARTDEPLPAPPRGLYGARVGLEYLPPATGARPGRVPPRGALRQDLALESLADEPPRSDDHRRHATVETVLDKSPVQPPPEREDQRFELPWTLDRKKIEHIEDPVEQLTLLFINNMLGEDRRRVQRRIGAPILANRWRRVSSYEGLETQLDRQSREDQALLLGATGGALLDKPLRKALRQTTFVHDYELVLDDFKAENVPFSGPYEDAHRHSTEWGRLSLRLRLANPYNPADLSYVNRGIRIGTSRERCRLSFGTELMDGMELAVHSNYYYHNGSIDLWGDILYSLSRDTRVHLLAGDKIDLLTGASLYPVVQSPVVLRAADQSPGLLVYVEYLF